MFQTVHSCLLEGLKGSLCEVECSIQPGFPCFHVLGLSATSAGGTHEKLLAAFKASGFPLPQERITLNVRPPRGGTVNALELSMVAGILSSQKLVPNTFFEDSIFVGELSLDGKLLALPSSFYYATWAKDNGYKRLIMPASSGDELPYLDDLEVIGLATIQDLIAFLRGNHQIAQSPTPQEPNKEEEICFSTFPDIPDLSQIQGQDDAKRALIIAATGFHNLLLMGPPGIGKSMLASSSIALLPKPSSSTLREIESLYSLTKESFPNGRPFRAPHHTIPPATFLGGGSPLKPGEISLAHGGILFLDEVAEYPRATLEALRLPLENHTIQLDRLKEHAEYPADFLLIAGMNPCPCGFYPNDKRCHCTQTQIESYQKRVSGPLSDRIDMISLLTSSLTAADCSISASMTTGEAQKMIREAIQRRRLRQGDMPNARIPSGQIDDYCRLTITASLLAKSAFETLALSMRGYHRFLRVARTIADLADHALIEDCDVLEAMHYSDKSLLK